MHKNITKCNKTLSKWCKNKHGASKIIDMFETYQWGRHWQLYTLRRMPNYRARSDWQIKSSKENYVREGAEAAPFCPDVSQCFNVILAPHILFMPWYINRRHKISCRQTDKCDTYLCHVLCIFGGKKITISANKLSANKIFLHLTLI
jgi:hypothetical protein